jgi:hypothetical protein
MLPAVASSASNANSFQRAKWFVPACSPLPATFRPRGEFGFQLKEGGGASDRKKKKRNVICFAFLEFCRHAHWKKKKAV